MITEDLSALEGLELLKPGVLRDGELELVLREASRADPATGRVPEYRFDLVLDGRRAGHLNLRLALTPRLNLVGGHVGYGVERSFRGEHVAARACALVAPLARRHGLEALVITVDEANTPSRRIAERLGAVLESTNLVAGPGGTGPVCRYVWSI